jgi:integrase
MGPRRLKNPDRYLIDRKGIYQYMRRVPLNVMELDERSPLVRISLKTDDLALARLKRDSYEQADDEYWAALLYGNEKDAAVKHYESAVKRAEALGFAYRASTELAKSPLHEIMSRYSSAAEQSFQPATESLFGTTKKPSVKVTKAFKVYLEDIVPGELVNKSANQKRSWKKVKQRAVNNFVEIVGDKAIGDIMREDAQKIHKHWLDRIAPKNGKPTHSASSGNRDIGNMRILFKEYFAHMGEPDRQNPFDGLSFSEKKKRSRPPFSLDWIKTKILAVGALAGMNDEARGVLLALIETGARPSELCNLTEDMIVLEHEIPHLKIEPRSDPDDPREIKTDSSVRTVPLIGMALEVFKKHPKGFPRYKDKEDSMSAALMAYFNENKLFPTDKHKIYSLRHSFEDRMKDAGLEDELRRILMGHTVDRPKYGSGGSLKWKRDELLKIKLPFDPQIV